MKPISPDTTAPSINGVGDGKYGVQVQQRAQGMGFE